MNRDVCVEYLKYLAFTDEQIEEFMPKFEYAIPVLGLTEQDLRFSMDEWLPQNFDMQYEGVKKLMGATLRETVDIAYTTEYNKQGVKIVYGILPAIQTNYTAIKEAGGDGVFVSFADHWLLCGLQYLFHKVDPCLEKAEEEGMTYGCRHCALNKTRIGGYRKGMMAAPDVIWAWGFNCDEGPKTDEYINMLYGEGEWPHVISRLPHDTHWGEKDDEMVDRIEFLAKELKDGQREIEEIIGIEVKPEHMQRAVANCQRRAFKAGSLVQLVCKSNPQVLGANALTMFCNIFALPMNAGLEYFEDAVDTMLREGRKAMKEGVGVIEKDAPKLGCYFVPYAVPWIDRIFRDNGVAMTFSTVLTPNKKMMQAPSFEEPFMATAEQWLRMPIGQNMRYEIDSMIDKAKSNNVDGMVMGFFDFDRWLGAHQKMCAKIIEKETGIPHFYMESDFWEDRDYSPQALKTRIESICQVIKMRLEQ